VDGLHRWVLSRCSGIKLKTAIAYYPMNRCIVGAWKVAPDMANVRLIAAVFQKGEAMYAIRIIGLSAVLTALCIGPTIAQSISEPTIAAPVCSFNAKDFSQNATIRAANEVMVCGEGGVWVATDKEAAGCLRDGDVSAVGTIRKIGVGDLMIECDADGTWRQHK